MFSLFYDFIAKLLYYEARAAMPTFSAALYSHRFEYAFPAPDKLLKNNQGYKRNHENMAVL